MIRLLFFSKDIDVKSFSLGKAINLIISVLQNLYLKYFE